MSKFNQLKKIVKKLMIYYSRDIISTNQTVIEH